MNSKDKNPEKTSLQDWINLPVLTRIGKKHKELPIYAVNISNAQFLTHLVTKHQRIEDKDEFTIEETSSCPPFIDFETGEIKIPDGKTLTLNLQQEFKSRSVIKDPQTEQDDKILQYKILKGQCLLLFFDSEPLQNYND